MISNEEFKSRRAALAERIADNSVVIVAANREITRSNDTEYLFRQHSDFHYLTGFPEPDAFFILEKVDGKVVSTLVCRAKDKLAEIWQGRRIGKDAAVEQFSVDFAYAESELDKVLHQAVNGKETIYYLLGEQDYLDEKIESTLKGLRGKSKQGLEAPSSVVDLRSIVHEMRLFKSAVEQQVMLTAGQISAKAHKRAMEFSASQIAKQQLVHEWQLEAEIHHEFAMNGARSPAYGTIVGGGENACILHYTENQQQINNGDLVLIDAGCELEGYAADITRTFPVSGKFNAEQKAIYQLVLDAQLTVIDNIKPGVSLKELTDISVRVISEGLVKLGILSGDIDELIANNAHRDYYMHGLAHWLGLDVHDVGNYNIEGEARALMPGMVFTVEPGIYISSDAKCDKKWHGIGVRIEDNILITEDGFKNLTSDAPKTIEEIEALMARNL